MRSVDIGPVCASKKNGRHVSIYTRIRKIYVGLFLVKVKMLHIGPVYTKVKKVGTGLAYTPVRNVIVSNSQ